MRRQIAAAGLLAGVALSAGCGKSQPAQAPSPTAPAATPAAGDAAAKPGGYSVTIQDHRFVPAEITVPANTAVALEVINKDPMSEEFESATLKVEKVIAGGDTATVRLRPLEPGRYPFVGEYHAATAQGVVIAK
jgi:plastocyanin